MSRSTRWVDDHVPDCAGTWVVVTGASSGLGLESARHLARRGADVVLTARSPERGEAALAAVRSSVPDGRLHLERLDVADLASVEAFAQRLRSLTDQVDVLLLNAGIMAVPRRQTTADGFELQLGTNHLGHFALAARLHDLVAAAPAGRVVSVSSLAARRAAVDFDDLMAERSYRPWRVYGQSKLANLLFTFELQRRLAAAGSAAIAVAAHPGGSATNLGTGTGAGPVALWLGRRLTQSAEQGALPQVAAAARPGVAGGDYLGPAGLGEVRGLPGPAGVPAAARRQADAERLWTVSEELTGLTFRP